MKKAALAFVLLIALASAVSAAMNPAFKECMQRGYKIESYNSYSTAHAEGQYCVFPDGSECLLEEFNSGRCGATFMTNDYCVKEGQFVWDRDRCCSGTIAYLKPYHAGQSMCIKISIPERVYNQLKYNMKIWLYLAVLAGLIASAVFIIRKIRK